MEGAADMEEGRLEGTAETVEMRLEGTVERRLEGEVEWEVEAEVEVEVEGVKGKERVLGGGSTVWIRLIFFGGGWARKL